MTDQTERRRDHALRECIDLLLDRVHRSRQEMIERGLAAMHTLVRAEAWSVAGATEDDRSGVS